MGSGRASVERDRRGRRVAERDRRGAPCAALTWGDDGRLAEATVRIPDGSWLRILPRAGHDPHWGVSDVVEHAGAALTHFAAVDWAAIDAIPPLAEPARLPSGGGTAVLNLIAQLAADQQRGPLAYRGPYPTEQLFLALLQCFRFERAEPDAADVHPLELFFASRLRWRPAPHARTFDARGACVQSRERVERVVWRGRVYLRPDWPGVALEPAHRVRDEGERVVCSLWALGAPLEDHLVLSRAGDVLETSAPAPAAGPPRPIPAPTAAGLVTVVIAGSAPPLAEAIAAEAAGLVFEWAALDGDLAALTGERARVAPALLRALAARLADAGTRAEQVRLGFAALTEIAQALGDGLRARAQARLARAGAAAQAEALGRTATEAAGAARRIGEAVERLLEDAAQLRA